MSVFDELVEELKEEHLLEETVLELTRHSGSAFAVPPPVPMEQNRGEEKLAGFEMEGNASSPAPMPDQGEIHRKRAMDEVSNLQMVEHVLSGVEREYMKMIPRAYDDLEVKKALHRYTQASATPESPESAEGRTILFEEIKNWSSALAKRDSEISIANLRRFCENSRPVLSSQALIALARFYRNSPFSEPVRIKFDYIITRLFSREGDDDKRKLLFPKPEMAGHLQGLYSNWGSLSIYSAAEHQNAVADARTALDSFGTEVESAGTFDVLITTNFLDRVKGFKEKIGELFYESSVLTNVIDCNVRIGNRCLDLIRKDAGTRGSETLESKYGYSHDVTLSTVAGRTIHLIEVLRGEALPEDELEAAEQAVEAAPKPVLDFERAPVEESKFAAIFAVNRGLLLAAVLGLATATGIYFWSESVDSGGQSSVAKAPAVPISSPELKQHIEQASSSNETLYAVLKPTWDALTEDDQKEFLKKVLAHAKSIRLNRVNLINSRGKTVGVATDTRLNVYGP